MNNSSSGGSDGKVSGMRPLLLGGLSLAVMVVVFFVVWAERRVPEIPEAQRIAEGLEEPFLQMRKSQQERERAPAAGSVAEGELVYNANCVACHQSEGQGKVGFAPFIRNPHFLAITSDEFLRATIVQGRPGTAMVPWAHLESGQIESLVAYMRSAVDPEVTPVATIDPGRKHPGDATSGTVLYGQFCASCHGENATGYAEGGPGPAIGNAGFLAIASDDYIFQTIKHGRTGTAMRPFSGSRGLANLSDQEIGDIVSYLRNRSDAPPPVASTGPDLNKGKMHFDANCAACHQPNGAGRPGIAPSIGNRDFLALVTDDFIKDVVRRGRFGTAMVQRPDLSDAVLDDIVAYLRSLPVENVVNIEVDSSRQLAALGDGKAGHQKFDLYCAACHGPEGQGYAVGGAGPGIGLSGFLGAVSDDYILQTLKQGRINTAMRPFMGARGLANLNEQDAHDIIAYMRSLSATSK